MRRNTLGHSRRTSRPAPLPFGLDALASTWKAWLPQVLLIIGATFWIYWPAVHGDWILDDRFYYIDNPLLQTWHGLWKFWFEPGNWIEYYPVEETVMWLQWQNWGNDSFPYHLTNIFLHIISSLLIWRLLGKFGLRLAWLGGLIFAIHPIQVESVASIAELKNTLSLPPFLLAMCAWIDFEEQGRSRDYLWALGLFLVAMLTKITMAAFPMVILLYAWWKRGRIQSSDLKASAPFFFVSLGLCLVTISASQRYEAMMHSHPDVIVLGGFLTRLVGAGLTLSFYFTQSVVPVVLTPYHPKWTVDAHRLIQFMPWLVFSGVLFCLWRKRATWGKHVLLGLGFFVLNLLPFLGFNSISYMTVTWVLDHLLYLPVIGLIGVAVAGLENLDTRHPTFSRPFGRCVLVVVLLLMTWKGHVYAGSIVDEEGLWKGMLQSDPASWLAHHNLGCYFIAKEKYPEAIAQLQEAVRLNPEFELAHYNLGLALDKSGRTDEAIGQYRAALRLDPDYSRACLNLGEIMRRKGNLPEAEALFRHGLNIAPDDASLCTNLGGLLLQTGRIPEAIGLYEHASEVSPDIAQVQYDLGVALLQTGNVPEAAQHLDAAVRLNPALASAHLNLGVALARLGHLPEAIRQFEAVLQIDPHSGQARDNLALALAQTGHIPEAIAQFQQELQNNPNDEKARDSLVKLQALPKNGSPEK